MNIKDIVISWDEDVKIDSTELGQESLHVPFLHNKYYKIYIAERVIYFKFQSDYKKLYKIKYEYYGGTLDQEELKKRGWEPQPLKILRQDIPMYMDADEDLDKLKIDMQIQEEKINMLESIIKTINNRGYLIKNAVEWEKFKNGI